MIRTTTHCTHYIRCFVAAIVAGGIFNTADGLVSDSLLGFSSARQGGTLDAAALKAVLSSSLGIVGVLYSVLLGQTLGTSISRTLGYSRAVSGEISAVEVRTILEIYSTLRFHVGTLSGDGG